MQGNLENKLDWMEACVALKPALSNHADGPFPDAKAANSTGLMQPFWTEHW